MVNAIKCLVIAEAGVNHNGSEKLALDLVDAAAAAGADAVKFQTFQAEKLVSASAPKAEYQKRQTGAGDQLSMLRALELSEDAHRAVAARCIEHGIEFLSTPFDEDSARFLINLGMKRIKVPSGELTNRPFLEFLAGFDLPLIVSTGMGTLDEVHEAISWIAAVRKARNFKGALSNYITLLHCTSNYPAVEDDVNLLAMRTLNEECKLPAGYSDHTLGIAVATAAAALGATVIEKHFTLDRNMPGPDHQASLLPHELADMVKAIQGVARALGDGVKMPRPAEYPIREVARRSVVITHDLPEGHCLKREDLVLLRPGTGIPPKELESTIGRRLVKPMEAGTVLRWNDLA